MDRKSQMPKGQKHHVRVMGEAAQIVRRLRETDVTGGGLMDEYQCGYVALMRAVLSRMGRGEYRALAKKRFAAGGVENRFKAGHETWNGGMKGLRIPGSEAGWFKKGEIRGASARKYRGIGTIGVRRGNLKSQYKCARRFGSQRWIKVDEGKYVPYARYLWERANGPVPAGWFVVHANHMTMDDQIENLILVDRKEHARRLKQRPDVEAKRIKSLRLSAARRRRESGAAKQWAKGQKRQSRTIWECADCGADVAPGTAQCPKCSSGSITQTRSRPMPDSMVLEGMELQEVGT